MSMLSRKRSQEEMIENEVMVDEWEGEEQVWIGGNLEGQFHYGPETLSVFRFLAYTMAR